MPLRSKRNRNPNRSNREKPETVSDIKSENPSVFFAETENQMFKNGKSANRNEHQNRKTEVFGYKNRKTDLKMAKTAKPKIQCPPLSATSRENDLPVESYTEESGKKVSLGILRVLTFFLGEKDLFIENLLHRLNLFGHL